ncbi:putative multiple-sugar transport system permease YteP [Clostridium puniceum]|uniref:Putative multiple-sugar transport system permease YteP n=1 Tax=Clostridium puniceum TaxID=29367 RepID=A0A1S8T7U9_9CLOT|nr:ABC transporter permease subunit [Clostridium puniceum]OOM73535.1 putative multiple-sugar transport system permease YteP [Clostridium puniceum]
MKKKLMQRNNSHVATIRKKTFWEKVRDNRTLLLMCLPAISFFIIFAYCPMPGAYIAFTDFNYKSGIFGSKFVGFDNFKFLIQSGSLWQLTRNTILYNIAFIVLGNMLQIFVAILLNEVKNKLFKKVAQTIMFLPYFISAVLIGLLAFNVLNYDFGFMNSIIKFFGGDPIKVYSMPMAWPIIIVIVNLWQQTGYGSIVYFASICGIDSSIIEAAEVDGANIIQRIRYIILPSLKPTAIILFLFAIGGIMKGNFGLFYNLVGSSNSLLFPTTDIIETYVYRTLMNNFNFANSAAVGLYQSVFGFILVMVCNWIVKKIDEEYALF